jgi:hypothetical protein
LETAIAGDRVLEIGEHSALFMPLDELVSYVSSAKAAATRLRLVVQRMPAGDWRSLKDQLRRGLSSGPSVVTESNLVIRPSRNSVNLLPVSSVPSPLSSSVASASLHASTRTNRGTPVEHAHPARPSADSFNTSSTATQPNTGSSPASAPSTPPTARASHASMNSPTSVHLAGPDATIPPKPPHSPLARHRVNGPGPLPKTLAVQETGADLARRPSPHVIEETSFGNATVSTASGPTTPNTKTASKTATLTRMHTPRNVTLPALRSPAIAAPFPPDQLGEIRVVQLTRSLGGRLGFSLAFAADAPRVASDACGVYFDQVTAPGLRTGDRLLAVNNTDIRSLPSGEVRACMCVCVRACVCVCVCVCACVCVCVCACV